MGNTTTSGRYDAGLLRGVSVPPGTGSRAASASASAPRTGASETRGDITISPVGGRYSWFINISRGAYDKPFQLSAEEGRDLVALLLPRVITEEAVTAMAEAARDARNELMAPARDTASWGEAPPAVRERWLAGIRAGIRAVTRSL